MMLQTGRDEPQTKGAGMNRRVASGGSGVDRRHDNRDIAASSNFEACRSIRRRKFRALIDSGQ
jgi:hypothetical protein